MEQLSSLRTLEDRGRRNRVRMDGQGLGKKQKARHRECSSTQVSVQKTDVQSQHMRLNIQRTDANLGHQAQSNGEFFSGVLQSGPKWSLYTNRLPSPPAVVKEGRLGVLSAQSARSEVLPSIRQSWLLPAGFATSIACEWPHR